ncbi:hypothetical protein ESY86_15200 [Subsaximicrobium wynnwilliamsii]|uniref:T9SS type A sorting domain-containing protein n=1 Tax=Subsaximicrobium wynnwilliamsii TaxID=291179 RepID=A0A5C6ZCN9_9FLAO|nr:hypothetical protein [Subsaximicrobium wynnwilliamsii]TXD82179.1 hypothetical protein ESY87_14790 [Subsaximicrobium wynnwilliamsii]TXD87819.1 hypothetical protein ESY86_15200 [Subsaximicrobium wynnwilliamsii]TXE01769.1 hypothetical protein ESY88_14365 [Subsaximicrobium wynnwilliamsii]
MTLTTTKFSTLTNSIRFTLVAVFLFLTSGVVAQITAAPNRVITDFVVIIKDPSGGFSSGDEDTILVQLYYKGESASHQNLYIGDETFISANEMSFKIKTSLNYDQFGDLWVNNADTEINIEYLKPIKKTLSNKSSENTVTRITEIFTDYNVGTSNNPTKPRTKGFWRSSQWKDDQGNEDLKPNSNHDLLAFTYDGITYSTGVKDSRLSDNEVTFTPQKFKAYSTNGVQGKIKREHYLITGDAVDGNISTNESATITSSTIKGFGIFKSIIDGVNGLDLGTGITNFNKDVTVKFFSGNGQVGAISDNIPDLVITQIADASDGSSDIYYYADEFGSIVGRPIRLDIKKNNNEDGDGLLARWRMDLFSYSSGNFQGAIPTVFATNQTATEKTLKMVGLRLEEFEINASNIDQVNNVNMGAGGNADIAFLAYNRDAFDIKSPVATRYPVSQFICKVPNTSSSITFNTIADIDGRNVPIESIPDNQTLTYEWFKENTATSSTGSLTPATVDAPFTLSGGITINDLGTYNLKISNSFGTIILPVSLEEGGTPAIWTGGPQFNFPPVYAAAGITPSDSDRNLIFAAEYNPTTAENLEGCNCRVQAGAKVTIPIGKTLKLYSEIIIEEEVPTEYDTDGNVIANSIPAGTFTLKDGASLIQTKAVTTNANSGTINKERTANNLNKYDYVYWSSPVENFNIDGISSNTPRYLWDPAASNTGVTGVSGNYISAAGSNMEAGRGYIVRVPNTMPAYPEAGISATSTLTGRPNNGNITIDIVPTSGTYDSTISNFNLIGNPYPSAIDADKFLTDHALTSQKIEGFVYIWTHNASPTALNSPYYQDYNLNYGNQYFTYNNTGSNPSQGSSFNGKIASGQAFFVQGIQSLTTSVPLTFENDLRFDSGPNYDNNDFYRNASADSEKQLVWLNLTNANNIATTALIGYVDGATYERDVLYDAHITDDTFSLHSVLNETVLSIQGRPLPFQESDLVPLGFTISENGIYKIGIDNLKGAVFVDQEQALYVEDLYLNLSHDLRQSPYSFTAIAGTVNDRFVLRYTAPTLSTNQVTSLDTFAFINNGVLKVQSSQDIEAVQIYDLTGKAIANYIPESLSKRFSKDFNFARGLYFAVITLENGFTVKKKLLN